VTIGIFGYQAYDTNRKQEEARIARRAEIDRTSEAMSMWFSRTTCLTSNFEERWREWYAGYPETQTITVYTFSKDDSRIIKKTPLTRTLPTPESLDEVTWGGTNRSATEGDSIDWRVSREHFDGLTIMIRNECALQFPPPAGWDESDVSSQWLNSKIQNYSLAPANMSICETNEYFEQFKWQDPIYLLVGKIFSCDSILNP